MIKTLRTLAALVLLAAALPTVACNPNPRAVARTAQAVAVEFRKELVAMRDAGEITPDAFAAVAPVVDEIASVGAEGVTTFAAWGVMTKTERRDAALDFADELTASVARLQTQGALHVETERARARLDKYLTRARRGVSAARIIVAALDDSN